MAHVNTENLDLEKNGWELLMNDKNNLPAKIGDVVKIIVVTVSPLDYENNRPITSVSHESLWVEVKKITDKKYAGILRTKPSHEMKIKDGTEFNIGDEISFDEKNIVNIRNFH